MAVNVYDPKDCVVFRRTGTKWGELSNMAPGLAIEVGGIWIKTIEALYQACRYPHLPDVQREIISQHSPLIAKRLSSSHRAESRPDWARVRVPIMRWCLRLKLAHNLERFGRLLAQTGERSIVESSSKDAFWGAKPQADGRLVGNNRLGRLLEELRGELGRPDGELRVVDPPDVEGLLLYGRPVRRVTTRPLSTVPPPPTGITIEEYEQKVRANEPRHLFTGGYGSSPLAGADGSGVPTGLEAVIHQRFHQPAEGPPTARQQAVDLEVQRYMLQHPGVTDIDAQLAVLLARRAKRQPIAERQAAEKAATQERAKKARATRDAADKRAAQYRAKREEEKAAVKRAKRTEAARKRRAAKRQKTAADSA